MSQSRFDSVDDYLAALDPIEAGTMRSIIDAILTEFPETEVKLAWNVPQIHRGKDYVFGMSAAKNHLSLNPWSERVLNDVRSRLEKSYVVLQSIFKVPVDWDVDRALLGDLVRARLAELDAA
ncbi:MAG TPA: DUF1801 domain-containing protein [Thermomicrobiales bacterium]|nr:DUF1801 domain-containing protein [Thermomicrobiales bacterium]